MSLRLGARAHQRLALITTQLATLASHSALSPTCTDAHESQGEITPLVEKIHAFTKAYNTRVAVVATGAGSVRCFAIPLHLRAWCRSILAPMPAAAVTDKCSQLQHLIKSLLSVPGASSSVLEAVVPYAVEAQTEYLGYAVHASVDPATARDFAETALQRATSMCEAAMINARDDVGDMLPVGLAVTASLATNRARRGANRALVATAIPGKVKLFELSLEKERRDREGEDICVTWTMLHALSIAIGEASGKSAPDATLPTNLLDGTGEGIVVTDVTPPIDPIAALIAGNVRSVAVHPSGRISADCPFKGAVLAGSFNPLHEGHIGLLTAAAHATSQPMAFELALTNADKGSLDVETVAQRVGQFAPGGVGEGMTLLLTMAPTFIDKTASLPGALDLDPLE